MVEEEVIFFVSDDVYRSDLQIPTQMQGSEKVQIQCSQPKHGTRITSVPYLELQT